MSHSTNHLHASIATSHVNGGDAKAQILSAELLRELLEDVPLFSDALALPVDDPRWLIDLSSAVGSIARFYKAQQPDLHMLITRVRVLAIRALLYLEVATATSVRQADATDQDPSRPLPPPSVAFNDTSPF